MIDRISGSNANIVNVPQTASARPLSSLRQAYAVQQQRGVKHPLEGISEKSREKASLYTPAENPEQAEKSSSPMQMMLLRAEAAANITSGNTHYDKGVSGLNAAPQASAKGEAGQADAAQKGEESGPIEQKSGCKTCESRRYQDGSDDPGVSFQTPKGLPASTSGLFVASHEGEHATRETARAQENGEIILQKSVTTHMACCPECKRFYVKGGVTRVNKMSGGEGPQAAVQKQADLLGSAGENANVGL